ncbi:hypothetical protein [Tsuneonella troitsensis]|uniref:hypothetical protein n=1 Tax=Tsuneonella troitsensis TaxID=292222 RepID=UPI00070DDE06|nr:hypothetical protein [Tsuneonella troitsensis]
MTATVDFAAARPPLSRTLGRGRRASLASLLAFLVGAGLQVALYQSLAPLLLALVVLLPPVLFLSMRGSGDRQDSTIFVRSFSIGLLAAGIASYYAIALYDPLQLASDAYSFFDLSSRAGAVRSLQDLRTVTEGSGAVVLWSWFYDTAALLGFPREQYVGITMNVLIVAIASVVCARSARELYGHDDYRFQRLTLFISISGNLWLLAGVHLRDSVIYLAIALLSHFWIRYLARVETGKLTAAVVVTLGMMPTLQVLRAEFFFIPIIIAAMAMISLNFSRGRGDSRFIMLLSTLLGSALVVLAVVVFGDEIQRMLLTGQDQYSSAANQESRSGSLGTSLIVNQPFYIRLALGLPYLFYFPIPAWNGLDSNSAIPFFKSLNAVTFYAISGFVFVGIYRIARDPRLRSPAFVFVSATPVVLSAIIVMTSLETRHLAAFMSFFFLTGLLPDLRDPADRSTVRLVLTTIILGMLLVHGAWFGLRYA